MLQAKLLEKQANKPELCRMYLEAAKQFVQTNYNTEALDAFKGAVAIFDELGDTLSVANWCIKIAELYVEENDNVQGAEFYDKAIKYNSNLVDQLVDKRARCAINTGDYAFAFEVYEKSALRRPFIAHFYSADTFHDVNFCYDIDSHVMVGFTSKM
jgi:tetratricopeptide (TPR) repeat protein